MSVVKRSTVCLVIVILACTCRKSGTPAPPATPVPARVGEMLAVTSSGTDQETVQMSEQGGAWHTCAPGEQLREGASLRVGKGASALVMLEGRRELALSPGTEVKMGAPGSIELSGGASWISTTLREDPSPVTIDTPAGRIRIDDAVASVILHGKELRVAVVSGSVLLERSGGEVPLRAGQEARTAGERVAVLPLRDPAGLAGWTRGLRAGIVSASTGSGQGEPGSGTGVRRGLGTLSARTARGDKPVPFHVVSQKVTIRIQDAVALTEVEQVFRNPTKATVEGTYRFSLPPGARINRYAMEIKGKMMEGEIVTRARGRKIMKTVRDLFLDPALTEWESGSTFKTRIFPIFSGQERKVVVSYIQTLPGVHGSHRYVLPLAADGLTIPEMSIRATISGSRGAPAVRTPLYPAAVTTSEGRTEVTFTAQEFTPLADLVLDIDSTRKADAELVTFAGKGKEHDYFMLSLTPDLADVKATFPGASDWILLVDTSRSRSAIDMEIQRRLVGSIIASLSTRDRVKIIAYDVHPRSYGDGWETPSAELVEEAGAFVAGLPPAGATNLGEALAAAGEAAGEGGTRIVLIGDGAATLGETRPDRLAALASSLPGGSKMTTIGVGSSVDSLLLGRLARQSGGQHHHLSTGEDLWAAAVGIITAMRTPVLEDVRIAFEGIEVEEIFPERVSNLIPGEDLVVTGRYAGQGDVSVTLQGRVAGADIERTYGFKVGEPGETNAFVPLTWASSKIDALTLEGGAEAVEKIEKLSKDYALATRFTSFIVLESEKMYKDFAVKQDDDRFEWTGEESIEYEDALGALLGTEDLADVLDGIAGGGAGAGGLGKAAGGMGSLAHIGGHPSYATVKTASIEKVEVAADDAASLARVQELRSAVVDKPLSRSARKALVDFFMSRHRYAEAHQVASAWFEMDGRNPDVLLLMGRLAWIRGKPAEALRTTSGVLDVSPEARSVMKRLAAYHEMHGEWEQAHAYRFSLYLLTPRDPNAAANAVFSFVRIGERDEAMQIAKERFLREVNGKLVVRHDVTLPAHKLGLLEAIVKGEDPPQLQETPGSYSVEDSRLVARLTWEGDVDLDLWVTGPHERLLGLGAGTGKIKLSSGGGEEEIYYLNVPDEGSYRFRVICADEKGCPSASGTLQIQALERKETVAFEMKGGWAVDLARVTIGSKSVTKSAGTMITYPSGLVVKGSLDKNVIQKVARQRKGQVKYCYEVALQKSSGLKGKAVLMFIVSAQGSVIQSKIKSSTLGSPYLESCLTAKVRTWTFPQPQGGGIVAVELPIVFSPK